MNIIKYILQIFIPIVIISGIVFAGSLTPSGNTSTSNFVTLEDLYNKISDNTFATSSHSVSTSSAPDGSMYTLQDIFNAIPTLSAEDIISGNTIMSVAGTYDISNLTENNVRTGTTFGTSSTGTMSEGYAYGDASATKVLTTATGAGTYDASNLTAGNVKLGVSFGVGLTGTLRETLINATGTFSDNGSGASYTDQNTGIMWQGADAGPGSSNRYYYDTRFGAYGASEYCAGLSLSGYDDWRMPTVKEWSSIIDYSTTTPGTHLPGITSGVNYWTVNTYLGGTNIAWVVAGTNGVLNGLSMGSYARLRCVRP